MENHRDTVGTTAAGGPPPDLPPPLPTRSSPAAATPSAQARGTHGLHTDAPLLEFEDGAIASPRRPAPRVEAPDRDNDESEDLQPSPLVQSFVLWGIVSLVFGIFMIWVNTAPTVLRANFFMKVLAILVGAGCGATGAVIGDALRKFTRPDAFFTSGGMGQILWLKLFWMGGPQIIGMVIGTLLGIGMVLQ